MKNDEITDTAQMNTQNRKYSCYKEDRNESIK